MFEWLTSIPAWGWVLLVLQVLIGIFILRGVVGLAGGILIKMEELKKSLRTIQDTLDHS